MFLLHVGPHKTATTWLQQNFHHNIKALEKAGWYYPQTGERVRVAHHDLSDDPDDILDPKSRKVRELKAIARKSRDKGLNVLLSSEGFRNWKPQHLEVLQAIMAPHEMHIVYCLRDPATRFYSFWAQQIKTGSKLSFPEFSQRQLRRPLVSRILNPGLEIDALVSLKGASVTLLLYDEIRRQKRDIFDVFTADVLKIEPLEHVSDVPINERQPMEMTEFMRLMLVRVGTWREEAEVNIGRVFHYMLGARSREKIIRIVGKVEHARKVITIHRDRPTFRKVEKRLLKKYRQLMVPQPVDDSLFLNGDERCAYYDGAILEADPAVKRLLDDFSVKFRPGGPRLWVMGWSRFWLTLWRRIVKFFRR